VLTIKGNIKRQVIDLEQSLSFELGAGFLKASKNLFESIINDYFNRSSYAKIIGIKIIYYGDIYG